jgi:hypothetical protein
VAAHRSDRDDLIDILALEHFQIMVGANEYVSLLDFDEKLSTNGICISKLPRV